MTAVTTALWRSLLPYVQCDWFIGSFKTRQGMNRQPQHRGQSSWPQVRHLCILYPAWIQVTYRRGNTSSRQAPCPILSHQRVLLQSSSKKLELWSESYGLCYNHGLFIQPLRHKANKSHTPLNSKHWTPAFIKSHKTSALATASATEVVEVPEQTRCPGWGLLLYAPRPPHIWFK